MNTVLHFRSGLTSLPLLLTTERCTELQNRMLVDISDKMAEVEETLKRIENHKGVIGTIVVNAEGIPIRTTLDNSTTLRYASLLGQLSTMAQSTVRDIDPQNDLTFLRIRTKEHEILVALEDDFLLIAIQKPSK
ncbi:dynein light chain roadblock-type 2-like [Notolabrus celidotus]|uniref:dynein light chain roadblock-type 2-like n=1 Tax=Notolabrus celidotus TaxID=1203425 RepID=UPI00148FC768|nr:dynein light chain roadblock-type 2-like [Notolabrus celidotus]